MLIWKIIAELQVNTRWLDLDTDSKRTLIDHHMRRLLINPRLAQNKTAWKTTLEKELHRSGCVLQRGTSESAKQSNLAGIKEFKNQIEREEQGLETEPAHFQHEQSLEVDWDDAQWDHWQPAKSSKGENTNWSGKPWSSSTPTKKEEGKSTRRPDWEAQLMKQYNTTSTPPKTLSYKPDQTPEATIQKRAETAKAMSDIRAKHDASEASKRRASSSNQPK